MWFDSHCHIPFEGAFGGLGADAIVHARSAGVTRVVTVGTDAAQSAAGLELAAAHDGVWATVGLHPHDASAGVGTVEPLLRGQEKLVAVGECGLDYHYDLSPRARQREAFAAQISWAKDLGLALVIHTREAWDDTFALLAGSAPPDRVIFHCFTGGPKEAKRALDLGAWLSFSGVITFKNASEIRQAAALCPLERLLVETDAPFLAPVPHRGQANSPRYVPLVGAAVASVKNMKVAAVEESTWSAACAAFSLPLS